MNQKDAVTDRQKTHYAKTEYESYKIICEFNTSDKKYQEAEAEKVESRCYKKEPLQRQHEYLKS
jgi:hypothetical protein